MPQLKRASLITMLQPEFFIVFEITICLLVFWAVIPPTAHFPIPFQNPRVARYERNWQANTQWHWHRSGQTH